MAYQKLTYKNNNGEPCTRVGTILYEGEIYIIFRPADMEDEKNSLYREIPIHKKKQLIHRENAN